MNDSFGPRFPAPEHCPHCRSHNFAHIVYGLPTEEPAVRAREGEFVLGGCTLGEASWYCRSCGQSWPKERLWPTDEEDLVLRLRRECHGKRPDVFLRMVARKLRCWCLDFLDRHFLVPLLIRWEHGTISRKLRMKDGSFQYMVRFRTGVVRVRRCSADACLEALCVRGPSGGTRKKNRYEAAALLIVMRE